MISRFTFDGDPKAPGQSGLNAVRTSLHDAHQDSGRVASSCRADGDRIGRAGFRAILCLLMSVGLIQQH